MMCLYSHILIDDQIDQIVIHLDHLAKEDVQKLLKILEPYDDKLEVKTKSSFAVDGDVSIFSLSLSSGAT